MVVIGSVKRVTIEQSVFAKDPEIAQVGHGRRIRGRFQHRGLGLPRGVVHHDDVELGRGEPRDFEREVQIKRGEIGQLDRQRVEVPGGLLWQPVEGDGQEPQLFRRQVVDEDAGKVVKAKPARRFHDVMAIHDLAISRDQDRPRHPESLQAPHYIGDVSLVEFMDPTTSRAQGGYRQIDKLEPGPQIITPGAGSIPRLGLLGAGLAALPRLDLQGRGECVRTRFPGAHTRSLGTVTATKTARPVTAPSVAKSNMVRGTRSDLARGEPFDPLLSPKRQVRILTGKDC